MQEEKQKFSPIKQRILSFANGLGVSKREFYEKIGVSRGTLESPTGITEDVMAKFIASFPNVSITWLINGEGPVYKMPEPDKCNIKKTDDEEKGIPLIPLNAMAGAASGELQVMEYQCDRYVVPAFEDADFLITVKGNSMSPTYSSGDLVACKRLNRGSAFFQWNKAYVLDTDQGALIKRVQPGHDDEHIKIVSDNSDYAPFELETEHIYAIALVVGMIRME